MNFLSSLISKKLGVTAAVVALAYPLAQAYVDAHAPKVEP